MLVLYLLFYFVISSSKSNIFERRDTSSRDVEREKVATIVKPDSVCERGNFCRDRKIDRKKERDRERERVRERVRERERERVRVTERKR